MCYQVDTSSLVSGEKPVKKQYDNVFVMGSRHKMDETVPPFQTEAAQFTIPTTIREIIERRSKVKGEDEEVKDTCFQSHVVTYKYNPFVYTEDSTIQVRNSDKRKNEGKFTRAVTTTRPIDNG